ncbi:S41 family peptidase [Bacteroidota bacterium]
MLLIYTPVFSQLNADGFKLMEVFDKISKYYVDSIDEGKYVEETIIHMLHELDPHSSYISAEELKAISEQMNGEFEGIGVSFNILNDTIFIVNTIQGGPSEKVGILPGDRIVKVDEEEVAGIGISTSGVQKRLKGPKGTKVDVTVYRKNSGEELDFTITRDKIPVFSLDASYMIDDETGYIKLSRFSQTTTQEFEKAMKELQDEGMESLILDLSDNGGGYLRVAVQLADHFLSDAKQIVYTQGDKVPRRTYTATSKGFFEEGKLVIMIDESSASASEIVSGAVQDWDRAVLVGRRSFGKGLVQQPFRLNDGSEMRLTIARYYTPTGRLIQKPYEDNFEDYRMDIINRYNSGELNNSDSIFFPDSLKYETLVKNRTVYGGGGIMPDYFIPIDTATFTDYFNALIRRGLFNQYVLRYMDANRSKLERKYKDFDSYHRKFDPASAMEELIAYAEKEGLSFEDVQWKKSELRIQNLFKAYVARDLWDSSRFYEIYNETEAVFLKAKQILEDPAYYTDKL